MLGSGPADCVTGKGLAGGGFIKTEFADHAGVTRQTISNYIDLLLETDVVEEVPNTSPRRYQVAKSDVVQELFELNSALNYVGEYHSNPIRPQYN
jgi:predicted transcriptional regulator